jgi:acetyltransferase-like isoleucine patch superfamily enzyme
VVSSILNDSAQLVDGLAGRKSLELISAIYESIETGREVSCVSSIPVAGSGSAMGDPTMLSTGIVDVGFGERIRVVQPANLYGCEIGDDCFVGPFVEIQKDSRVGARCRVQSHSFICELVTIGDDCFIGHGVMFVNDTFSSGGPARGRRELWKSTSVGNRVSIGSNATILPVRICDGAVIGAGAVVTRDIEMPGVYAGNPARLLRPLKGSAG